jgi:hypothetical protein
MDILASIKDDAESIKKLTRMDRDKKVPSYIKIAMQDAFFAASSIIDKVDKILLERKKLRRVT